ncbi:MAG: DNA-binding protein with winged-HTH domain [Acidobacteria bacterium]|nr:DNA-binding protein with winged-HTH domain [Acidobacteriota bacterium]
MPAPFGERYQFGEFELETTELVLRRKGEIVPLTPKALQVLVLLVRDSGRVVSRKHILESLWPDSFVEDSNLTVAISMLRRALGGSEDGDRFIETAAKRGYRFVAAVKSASNLPPRPEAFGGMQITRLTHDGLIMDVALSADGRLMAYVQIAAGKQSLRIKDLHSGEKWQLRAPDPALCWGLRFTPDGKNLFFITTQPNSTISVLYRMAVSGGPAQKLVVNIDAGIALSPDGMEIAFVRSFPGQHRDALVVANVDGSAQREIVSRQHPDKFSFATASWSPDGTMIALGASRYSAVEFAILGVPRRGGKPRELTQWHWKAMCAVAWNDDGTSLYFSAMASNSNSFQIWRLTYPEGPAQRVTNDPNNYEEISLADKANTLVTMQTEVRSNLWLASSTGATAPGVARRITQGRTEGFEGLALARGRAIYAATEHQQADLWSVSFAGSDPRQLTDAGGFLPSACLNEPLIAYVSAQSGTHHIWCMDADGGNKRQLTDGGGESFPSITCDGKWVVFTSLSRERNTLWKIPTRAGKPVQLTHDNLCIKPVVSHDGTRVACAYRRDEADMWKIAVLSIDDGTPLMILDLPYPYNQKIRWTADDQALTFLEKRDGVHNVWRQPLDGTAATQLTQFTEDLIYFYDWLPDDDTRLIASRGIKTRDIVMIQNFE